jgi:hypothetical protein
LIKERLCDEGNLLALPDWDRPFVLESDSSDYFGHVTLSQYEPGSKSKLRPVEFHSFAIPARTWKVGAYERELYCVYEGVRHFSGYLDFAQEFEVRIDQASLRHLHTQAHVNAKYSRQVQLFATYKIKWVYQEAARHGHIDCFTRPPFTPTCLRYWPTRSRRKSCYAAPRSRRFSVSSAWRRRRRRMPAPCRSSTWRARTRTSLCASLRPASLCASFRRAPALWQHLPPQRPTELRRLLRRRLRPLRWLHRRLQHLRQVPHRPYQLRWDRRRWWLRLRLGLRLWPRCRFVRRGRRRRRCRRFPRRVTPLPLGRVGR